MDLRAILHRLLPDPDRLLLRSLISPQALSVRHSAGRPFEEHLCGTRRILDAWHQPVFIQMAGLCHSLYSTDRFDQRTLSIESRERLSQFIGEQAEKLVYLFCAVKRGSFFRALSFADMSLPLSLITVEGREELGPPHHDISTKDAANLAILHLANLAEQSTGRNGTPAIWLERFANLSRLVLKGIPEVMPEILPAVAPVTRYAEREALNHYYTAGRHLNRPALAIESMEKCGSLLPCLAEPDLWLSYFWGVLGDSSKQAAFAKKGLRKLQLWGVSWDKRLSYEDWEGVARLRASGHAKLRALMSTSSPLTSTASEVSANVRGVPNSVAPMAGESRFESYLLKYASSADRQSASFFPGLRQDVFWEAGSFELANALERDRALIQNEVDNLDLGLFQNEAEKIQRTGAWKVYILLEAGRWKEEHCDRLPHLYNILRASPEVRIAGGLIYLSRLVPGTEVAAHTGPTNMRLRMHFGLHVPDGDCALRVAGMERKWEAGKALVFSDFYEHEVWNRTTQDRTVLLIDVWHPDLSTNERAMLEAVHRMASEHGRGLAHYWKLNEAAESSGGTHQHEHETKFDDLTF